MMKMKRNLEIITSSKIQVGSTEGGVSETMFKPHKNLLTLIHPLFINGDRMSKEELNEYGYPIHPKSDYSKPPEGDFGTWVGLILVFGVMGLGVLKLGGII